MDTQGPVVLRVKSILDDFGFVLPRTIACLRISIARVRLLVFDCSYSMYLFIDSMQGKRMLAAPR